MPYLPRYLIIGDNCYFHVTWQCHNKDWLMQHDWAKKIYYDLLLKYKDNHGVEIYSYSFMDNHPHIAGFLTSKESFSAFFRIVNGMFARKINKRLGRRGQVVMDRFKSPRIETDKYMLTAMTYIDLNQYRAGKVKHPKENDWSSYHYYAHGKADKLVTPSPSYLALGNTARERQSIYRGMVEALIENSEVLNISNTYFFGDPDWVIAKYDEFRSMINEKNSHRPKMSATAPPL